MQLGFMIPSVVFEIMSMSNIHSKNKENQSSLEMAGEIEEHNLREVKGKEVVSQVRGPVFKSQVSHLLRG